MKYPKVWGEGSVSAAAEAEGRLRHIKNNSPAGAYRWAQGDGYQIKSGGGFDNIILTGGVKEEQKRATPLISASVVRDIPNLFTGMGATPYSMVRSTLRLGAVKPNTAAPIIKSHSFNKKGKAIQIQTYREMQAVHAIDKYPVTAVRWSGNKHYLKFDHPTYVTPPVTMVRRFDGLYWMLVQGLEEEAPRGCFMRDEHDYEVSGQNKYYFYNKPDLGSDGVIDPEHKAAGNNVPEGGGNLAEGTLTIISPPPTSIRFNPIQTYCGTLDWGEVHIETSGAQAGYDEWGDALSTGRIRISSLRNNRDNEVETYDVYYEGGMITDLAEPTPYTPGRAYILGCSMRTSISENQEFFLVDAGVNGDLKMIPLEVLPPGLREDVNAEGVDWFAPKGYPTVSEKRTSPRNCHISCILAGRGVYMDNGKILWVYQMFDSSPFPGVHAGAGGGGAYAIVIDIQSKTMSASRYIPELPRFPDEYYIPIHGNILGHKGILNRRKLNYYIVPVFIHIPNRLIIRAHLTEFFTSKYQVTSVDGDYLNDRYSMFPALRDTCSSVCQIFAYTDDFGESFHALQMNGIPRDRFDASLCFIGNPFVVSYEGHLMLPITHKTYQSASPTLEFYLSTDGGDSWELDRSGIPYGDFNKAVVREIGGVLGYHRAALSGVDELQCPLDHIYVKGGQNILIDLIKAHTSYQTGTRYFKWVRDKDGAVPYDPIRPWVYDFRYQKPNTGEDS